MSHLDRRRGIISWASLTLCWALGGPRACQVVPLQAFPSDYLIRDITDAHYVIVRPVGQAGDWISSPAGMGSGRRSGILGPAGSSLALSGSSAGRNSGAGAYNGPDSSNSLLGCQTGWLGTRAGLMKSASRSGIGRVQMAFDGGAM